MKNLIIKPVILAAALISFVGNTHADQVAGSKTIDAERKHYFQQAAESGNLELVKLLWEKRMATNEADAFVATVNNPEMRNFFLGKGIHINAKESRGGNTALHNAIRLHNMDSIKFLLEAGADVNAENRFGETPLDYVFKFGGDNFSDTAILLLGKGATLKK